MEVNYSRPVCLIGLSGEVACPSTMMDLTGKGFDEMARVVLESAGFVGILSSWTNFAMLFRKKMIVVSFTPDIPTDNPRAVKLVEPTREVLQAAVMEMGL